MSVKTVAQNFEHKPFAGTTTNNNNIERRSQNLVFNNQEISRERANSAKIRYDTNADQQTTTASSSTNELSKFKFKNSSLKKSSFPASTLRTPTNTTIRAPPTDDELRVKASVDEKTTQQLKNEEELKKLPAGSVLQSKLLLFEKAGGNQDTELVGPLRRHSAKSVGAAAGLRFTASTINEKRKKDLSDPSKSMQHSKSKSMRGDENNQQKGQEKTNAQFNLQQKGPAREKFLAGQVKGESESRNTDDISLTSAATGTTTAAQRKTDFQTKIKNSSVYEIKEEEYDVVDVNQVDTELTTSPTATSTTTTPTNKSLLRPQHLNIKQRLSSNVSKHVESPVVVSPTTSTFTPSSPLPDTPATPCSPLKMKKIFKQPLSGEKMQMPYGLDKWLEDIVIANRAKLKQLDINNNALHQSTPPPLSPNVTFAIANQQSMEEDDDEENYLVPGMQSSVAVATEESEKERQKREKREKKEKLKEEKRKDEENKKKIKGLKAFGLTPETLVTRTGGIYICAYDRITKQKLQLSYKANEELISVEVDSQYKQKGKMVVLSKDGRVGYVLKSDFGVKEENDESEMQDNKQEKKERKISLIPTEDDLDELYELPPTALPSPSAPPVPSTPRPQLQEKISIEEDEESLYEIMTI